MIENTEGIVLHNLKYGDTSLIVRIYTRRHGLQSFLFRGVRKARSKTRLYLLQPLSLVSLVYHQKTRGGLQHAREISGAAPLSGIPSDPGKTAVALFMAEVLLRVLKEQTANPPLFDFLWQSIGTLDGTSGRIGGFPLVFLLQLSKFLGFQPRNNHSAVNPYFNLREGMFETVYPGEENGLDMLLSKHLSHLIPLGLQNLDELRIPPAERRVLLSRIIDYYRHHLEGMPALRAHLVLESVLGA